MKRQFLGLTHICVLFRTNSCCFVALDPAALLSNHAYHRFAPSSFTAFFAPFFACPFVTCCGCTPIHMRHSECDARTRVQVERRSQSRTPERPCRSTVPESFALHTHHASLRCACFIVSRAFSPFETLSAAARSSIGRPSRAKRGCRRRETATRFRCSCARARARLSALRC